MIVPSPHGVMGYRIRAVQVWPQRGDNPRFIGRRIDVWGRSIEKLPSENPIQAVQRYLRTHHSDSARLVAECPVVVLWPAERLGEIIWRG
jgi:hypothetical protein